MQITIALLSGLAIHKFSQFPFGQWMWVLPLVLLICTIIFAQIPLGESRIDYLFGWGGLPQNRHPPSYEVAITMPFYVSVVYSLGTLLGGFFPATHARTTEVPV